MPQQEERVDIRTVLKEQRIATCFQPVVSAAKKKIIGVEALSRGVDEEGRMVISPDRLFGAAAEEGLLVELDRLCRQRALEAFRHLHATDPELLLFLNIDAFVIEQANGSSHLEDMVNFVGLPFSNIVIEINEARDCKSSYLKSFADRYRELGYLIALDDVGVGFSNLDRIVLVRPDIIKVDRAIVSGIADQYHKQEMFKAIVNFSGMTGALVVAEGVETEQEAFCVMELGAGLLQGYFYSRPQPSAWYGTGECLANITDSFRKYRVHILRSMAEKLDKRKKYEEIVKTVLPRLRCERECNLEEALQDIMDRYPFIECAYILDQQGIQVSHTVCGRTMKTRSHIVFQPAQKGEDHTSKRFFHSFKCSGLDLFTSRAYLSLATGSPCITVIASVDSAEGTQLHLCVDFSAKEEDMND